MFPRILALLFFFSALSFAEPRYITFPSDISWSTQESDHFRIIFREGQNTFALRTLKAAERAHKLLTPIFSEHPTKTWIVLADFQDSTNGYALNFPYSHMVIFAAPPESTGQLSMLDHWLESVVLHEYVHILHLYPAHGLWSPIRTIFGTWVVPNGMMPSHFHEGMATFLETEFSLGGRGRSAHFQMYRRKAVEAGAWGKDFVPMDLMDGSIRRWPFGTSAYFWGEGLTRELWLRKGKQGLTDLTLSYSSNWPYFLHGPLKEVYGIDYSQLWDAAFIRTEKETRAELEKIKASPLSQLTYLTNTGYRKSDLALSPDGRRVAYRKDSPLIDEAGIEMIDLGSKKILADSELSMGSSEGFCWGRIPGKIPFLLVREAGSNGYETSTLQAFDIFKNRTKEKTPYQLDIDPMTLKGESEGLNLLHVHRIGCTNDLKHVFAYREVGGEGYVLHLETTLDKWTPETKILRRWKLPTDAWVTSLTVGDSAYFTAKIGNETTFYRWSLGKEPELLFTLNTYAYGLQVGRDPNELLAIVSIDRRDEVWSFDVARKTMTKKVAVTGGINSFVRVGEQFVVSSYEHKGDNSGYDVAIAAPVVGTPVPIPTAAQPPEEKIDLKVSEVKSYSALSTLFPRAWLPSVLLVPNGAQFGVMIPWFDLSQRHVYTLFGGYDTRGQPFGSLSHSYRFGGSYSLDSGAYYSPSYIITRTAFVNRWGGSVGVSGTIGSFPPTIRLAALYRNQEESVLAPQAQSVGAEIGLSYSIGFPRRPLGISPVNGIKFTATHSHFFKELGSTYGYFTDVGTVSFYQEAPWWKEHVWFLSAKIGYTQGTTFFNSYFEGGGELLFSQGRGLFLNRGFDNGAFLGRRMANVNLEYRFPLLWVERGVGYWPMKLNVIHAAFVADATTFDAGTDSLGVKTPDELFTANYYSAGFELKSDWKFFFYLPTTLRAGIYHGFGGPYSKNINVVLGMEASI